MKKTALALFAATIALHACKKHDPTEALEAAPILGIEEPDTCVATCGDNNPCTEDPVNTDGSCAEPIPRDCWAIAPDLRTTCDHCPPLMCEDYNACTDDTPVDGTCPFPNIACDDGNLNTIDSCDPASGCVYMPLMCEDYNACTDDTPVDGTCPFPNIACDDGNLNTIDSCDPASGCVYMPLMCEDYDACTDDTPVDGTCPFPNIACDDENEETTDTCDPASGCVFTWRMCEEGC